MDFNFTPEDEQFRAEFRAWLDQNRPERDDDDLDFFAEDEGEWNRRVKWFKKLASGGWTCVDWPKEYGGRGFGILRTIVYHQELARVRAPLPFIGSGVSLIGPTLMHWGTEEQKKRFIPKVLTGEEIWCQGYSEPGSGSDLASLQTRAAEDGDDFVVNGQKVWTSNAQFSDWIFLLVRTDPAAPKHKGISYLLVDMRSPGITVRPLVQMTGARGFNEVFFEDVRVPADQLVGEENQGWTYAKFLLGNERTGIARIGYTKLWMSQVKERAAQVRLNGATLLDDPLFAARVAEVENGLLALELTQMRVSGSEADGKPNPASSILKLRGSQLQQAATELFVEAAGPDALPFDAGDDIDVPTWAGEAAPRYLNFRKTSIFGGTNEIQRNIIASTILGL